MSRSTALRRQHDAASMLAAQLLVEIDNYRGRESAYAISLDLAKLLGLLQIHLAQEDRSLYPSMIASGNEQAAAVAQRFFAEMGGLCQRLQAFASRWSCPKAISSDFDRFRHETIMILAALNGRILRENEELYPLADALPVTPFKSVA
jgi:hypothetical protein